MTLKAVILLRVPLEAVILLRVTLEAVILLCLQVAEPVVKHSVHTLVFRSLKRSHDMFIHNEGLPVPEDDIAYVDRSTLHVAVQFM